MLIGYYKDENPLVKYHLHYLKKSKVGLTTIMAGDSFLRTGCGKSYTSLRLGELIDPDFGIHKVVYSPKEYLTVMDEVENNGKKGQVVVVDEGEVTASSKTWQSFRNQAIGYNLATGRYLQCMSIFVSPTFGWLDKRVRVLANHFGSTSKILDTREKPVVNLKYYRIATSQTDDRLWFRKLSMYDGVRKQIVTFKRFQVGLPTEKLCEEYEKKAFEFKSSLRKGLLRDLDKLEREETSKANASERKDFDALMAKALERPLIRQTLMEKGKVTNNLIRNELADEHLSYHHGSQLKSLIEMTWRGKK